MTQLLNNLTKEISVVDESGSTNLGSLLEDSDSLLAELRHLESLLATTEEDIPDLDSRIEQSSKTWYTKSILRLKAYNSLVNRFSKNIVHSHRYTLSLDNAYPFPLALNPYPVKDSPITDTTLWVAARNRQLLMKSIALHFLKTGHGPVVPHFASEIGPDMSAVDPASSANFFHLKTIVDSIRIDHDLSPALDWLASWPALPQSPSQRDLAFKFHVLQFALLLCGQCSSQKNTPDNAPIDPSSHAFDAYMYAKRHFPAYIADFFDEISPMMTLLLMRPSVDPIDSSSLRDLLYKAYESRSRRPATASRASESRFVHDILRSFGFFHENNDLFDALASDFMSLFCILQGLSSQLCLFQSLLAGFINIPNFYKYNNLQRRLSRGSRPSFGAFDEEKPVSLTPSKHDLPFQLPDTNRFLFRFHPIFICPVSKEQLMPLTTVSKITPKDIMEAKGKFVKYATNKKLEPMGNPVVVFNHCRHVALKDSVRNLSKGGSEVFKCHYCYKKHKLSEVKEAYFIDLPL